MKSLSVIIQKSYFGQQFIKLRRSLRGKNTPARSKLNSSSNFSKRFRNFFPAIPSWIIPISVVTVISIIFFAHIFQYNRIQVIPFDGADIQSRKRISGSMHTAIYGIKKIDGYIYVDYIALAKQDSRIRLINITPLFSASGESKTLRTSLNFEPVEGTTKIESLNDSVSDILGIRIDRYVVIDIQKVGNVFGGGANEIMSEMTDSDIVQESAYIVNQREGSEELFGSKFSWISKYIMFWKLNKLESVIYTDMSRGEFFNFVNSFDNRKNVITLGINIEHGVIDRTSEQSLSIRPNVILIDEQLSGFFSDFDISAEQTELEIYNASEQRGLAYKYSRQFQNLGINVVKYGNYFETVENTVIYLQSEGDLDRYKNTIQEIRNAVGDVTIEVGTYQYNQSGDIIVVLN